MKTRINFLVILSAYFLYANSAFANALVSQELTASTDLVQDGTPLEFTATIANTRKLTVTSAVLEDVSSVHISPAWSCCSYRLQCYTGYVISWIWVKYETV